MDAPATCYRHPDRETGLSCSECGRPICVDCMSVAPVGIRCPDHAGTRPKAGAGRRPARGGHHAPDLSSYVRTRGVPHDETLVTKVLIGLNVALYVLGVAQGAG